MIQDESPDQEGVAELTRAYIEKWQSLGLMPELAPGEVLVWKRTRETYHPYYVEWELRKDYYYEGRYGEAEFKLGMPYQCDGCTVTANPLSFHWYTDQEMEQREEKQGIALALRVPKNLLRVCPTYHGEGGNSFYAPVGIPVGAYNVGWSRHHEFHYHLKEGDDVLDLLSDPLVCVADDYVPKEDGKLPQHPSSIVKEKKYRYTAEDLKQIKHPIIDTAQAIELWQQRGLMPEARPGQLLVWKGVYRLGKFRGSAPEYRTRHYAETDFRFWLDTPYSLPDCEVSTSWEDTVWWDPEEGTAKLLCLALLVDRDGLSYEGLTLVDHDEDDLHCEFDAPRGVPVACYEAAPVGEHDEQEYALRLVEGEDALEWLP